MTIPQDRIERIAGWENLALAFVKARKGKRDRLDVRDFAANLDLRLRQIQTQVLSGNLTVGRSFSFRIRDPKPRTITAAVFPERVLHHAVMNVCAEDFERAAIYDSYACRPGKGRLKAVRRAQHFSQRRSFFLKMDMRAYFDSIDHEVLKRQLRRLFRKDGRIQCLFEQIVDSFEKEPGKGLPIGNLTSQFFANHYLGRYDRFVKEELRCRGYVRYMDDVVLWTGSRRRLCEWRDASREFLRRELRLELKEQPFINRGRLGLDFLGCRVFPGRVILSRRSRMRFVRKFRQLETEFLGGRWDDREFQRRMTALIGFPLRIESDSFRRRVIASSRVIA